jgi:hypothetical protein
MGQGDLGEEIRLDNDYLKTSNLRFRTSDENFLLKAETFPTTLRLTVSLSTDRANPLTEETQFI